MKEKIKKLEELNQIIADLKSTGKKIVHCHGVFDLLHIGHIKHFAQAKGLGDVLIVSITADQFVNKGPNRPAFSDQYRIEAVAALDAVDYVVLSKKPTAVKMIEALRPNIYCKGQDYLNKENDTSGEIRNEISAVKKIGGKIVHTKDITFSSSNLINKLGYIF